MSEAFIAAIISAAAILSGAIIGAICSSIISKKNTNKSIEVQNKILQENKAYKEKAQKKILCENVNQVRLDICTALFQSIRSLRLAAEVNEYPMYIPVNNDYSKLIIALSEAFDLREMSYIYQLYGIIEKINYDIKNLDYTNIKNYELIVIDFKIFLRKLYGENMSEVLLIDIDKVTYEELIDNKLIKSGYRVILNKLNSISNSVIL